MSIGDRVSPRVRRLPIAGGLLLLDQRSNCLFAYNDSARSLWDMIEAGWEPERAAPEYARTWGIPESAAQADIAAVHAEWQELGLLVAEASLPGPSFAQPEAVPSSLPTSVGYTSENTYTIRQTTVSIATETELMWPVRMLLRHLETPGVRAGAAIQIRLAAPGLFVVLRDGVERLRTNDPAQLVGGLWQTLLEVIYPNASWLAVIHGAALASGGKGLVLAAPSGSGKSTLAAGLLGRGFTYLADDSVALSAPDGLAVPWPLPLSIKPGSLDILLRLHPQLAQAPSYRTQKSEVRLLVPAPGVWDSSPVAIRHLVFPHRRRHAAPELRPLSAFAALQRLLADRVWLGNPMTLAGLESFLAWLHRTPRYSLDYDRLDDAVRLVEGLPS